MSTVSRIMDMFDQLDYPEAEVKEIIGNLRDALESRLLEDTPAESTGLYKHVYRLEILNREEEYPCDLGQIVYDITEGESSGLFTHVGSVELEKEAMAAELTNQGSDPEFLLGE
jgi:hypothetical protein